MSRETPELGGPVKAVPKSPRRSADTPDAMDSQAHHRADNNLPPLTSEFAGDAELTELVEFFVQEMDGRVRDLRTALEADDLQTLRRLAHQLKGAAGGYGFPVIGDAAATVERSIQGQEADLSSIRERAEDLITLCRRASAH